MAKMTKAQKIENLDKIAELLENLGYEVLSFGKPYDANAVEGEEDCQWFICVTDYTAGSIAFQTARWVLGTEQAQFKKRAKNNYEVVVCGNI